jgi:hypothetical protein
MSSDKHIDIEKVVIKLERDSGYFGSYEYKLELHGDGSLEIGMMHKPGPTDPFIPHATYIGNISKEEVSRIIKKALGIDFFSLKDEYSDPDMLDGWSTETEIQIGSLKKRIYNYAGAHKNLEKFNDLIDRICKTGEWLEEVGDENYGDGEIINRF